MSSLLCSFAGGATPSTPTATVEVFNINKNEWTYLPSLPKKLIGVKMAFLHGQIFVSGGLSDDMSEKSVLVGYVCICLVSKVPNLSLIFACIFSTQNHCLFDSAWMKSPQTGRFQDL